MSEALNPTLVVINLPVTDLEAATDWYRTVLDTEPSGAPSPTDVEFRLRDGVSLLLTTGDADAEAAGCKVLFGVEDLAAQQRRLKEAGVVSGDVQRIEGVLAWADFQSPQKHRLTLVEELT